MKFGLPISAGLHGLFGVSTLLLFTATPSPLAKTRIIPVTIVNIDAQTRRPETAVNLPQPQPVIENPAIVEIDPISKVAEPEIVEPEIADSVDPAVRSARDPAKQAGNIAEDESQIADAEDTPKPKTLSLDDLQNLANRAKSQSQTTSQPRLLTAERQDIIRQQSTDPHNTRLSTSYEDAIMRKVYQGWQIPIGAPNMAKLIVTVDIKLDREGRIETAKLSPDSLKRMRGDSFYSAAAENALRAVNEAAQFPFLPPEQYETWKNVSLTFYPQEAQPSVPT